jgi:hypothetical protein
MAFAWIRFFIIVAIFFTAWRSTPARAQSNADALSPSATLLGSMPRLVLAATPLLARDAEHAALADPHYEKRWYGWQTLIADAASLGLMIAGGAADSEALFWVGLGGFVFAPAIVHAAHARVAPALASFGVRVSVVLLVMFVALIAVTGAFVDDSKDGISALWIVMLGGVIGASALDAAVFGFERVRVGDQALVRPWYDARSGSAGLRVAGSF